MIGDPGALLGEHTMNIFFLSTNYRAAARALCDRHVVKMILEVCQLLWCAHHITGDTSIVPEEIKVFKQTHVKHPMAIWVRKAKENYTWAALHALEMCFEYTRRYKKKHSCEAALRWLKDNVPACDCEQEYGADTVLSEVDFPDGCSPVPLAITNKAHVVRVGGKISLVFSYLDYYKRDKSKKTWFTYNFTQNPFG